ncbi:MAG: RES family NAD+ phosphorylase [Gemmatimonadaceae bacterium]
MPFVYRVIKKRHPIYDATGSMLHGGRWSSAGRALIYASEHYATAILEKLVHAGRLQLPGPHHAAVIVIPDDLPTEQFDPARHPRWNTSDSIVARRFGDAWVGEARTSVLLVPSIPGQPAEWNYVINLAHPDATRIRVLQPFDVIWDGRLFGPPTSAPTEL